MAGQPLEVKLDASDLRAAYVQAKAAGGGLTKDLRKAVTSAAKPLEAAVKSHAPSSRISGAVTTKASFTAKPSVKVVVDAKKAPNAAPINNGGKGGTFRHPVWGDREVWVDQKAVPFFDAPIRGALPAADVAIVNALRDFEKRAGFK